MALGQKEVRLSIKANTKHFKDALAEMPGIGEKEAKKLARKFAIEFDKAEKAAIESSDKMAKNAGFRAADSQLKELKDSTGELDSSLKGLGGAVGLVSPEMERMLFVTGELSGGLEASSRLATLAGGSMKSLLVAGGALGLGIAALGGTWAIMSRKVAAAEERLAEAHKEMKEGIEFAKQYKDQLHGLQNSVGLLSDAEFALIDARRRSNEFMKDEIEGQRAQQSVLNNLRQDLEDLRVAQERLTKLQGSDALEVNAQTTVSFRNVKEAVRLTTEAMESGEPILESFGRESKHFTGRQVLAGEALMEVEDQITNLTGSIGIYETSIARTTAKTERLNLLMQAQAAQARNDRDEVARLAMALAVLSDTETMLFMASINAAKGMAIMQASMTNTGVAATVAIQGIENFFAQVEEVHAPEAFRDTLNKLNTELETTAENTTAVTEATEESLDVQALLDEQMAAQAKARADARSLVALEIGDRDAIIRAHKDKAKKISELLNEELISFNEFADEMVKIDQQKSDALLAHDISVAESKIATAEKVNSQIDGLIGISLDKRTAAIDEAEAAELARVEGNAEAEADIRSKFDERRKTELGALFKAQQATEIATTIMSGASAAIGALAPAPTGLGPVAGVPLAALIAATTAAQIGVISSQQPSFHQGGMIGGHGDQAITAQGGEAVLNRGAVASLGGAAGVDSLNAGAGGGGAVVVQMTYKQRVLDELVVDNLAKGGPLKRAINGAAKRGRRGRVGGLL